MISSFSIETFLFTTTPISTIGTIKGVKIQSAREFTKIVRAWHFDVGLKHNDSPLTYNI